MGDKTGIAWTERTWNPWYGCTKVSPGCAHCYMFREQRSYGRDPEVVTRSKTTFDAPLHWTSGGLVFTCSWSDWFHEAADPWRSEAWGIIRRTPHLTYQILTKRPERIAAHLPKDWGYGWPNVWLGVSIENQRWMTRLDALVWTPARLRFLSCEPLLGPLNLGLLDGPRRDNRNVVSWVIAGGESGPDARPCDIGWLRSLRDQCRSAMTPFFLKQLGGYPNPRAHALALLDGQTYTEMPTAQPEGG